MTNNETEKKNASVSNDELISQFNTLAQELMQIKGLTNQLQSEILESLLDLCYEILYDMTDEGTSVQQIRDNVQDYSEDYCRTITTSIFMRLRSYEISKYPLLEGRIATAERVVY